MFEQKRPPGIPDFKTQICTTLPLLNSCRPTCSSSCVAACVWEAAETLIFITPETNLALNQLLTLTRLSRRALVNFLRSTPALKCIKEGKRKEIRERLLYCEPNNTSPQPDVHEMTVKVTSNHEGTLYAHREDVTNEISIVFCGL